MVTQTIVTIKIPRHGDWQRTTKGEKHWKALAVDFFDDKRVVAVMAQCPDAIFCYQYLLLQADDEGTYSATMDSLRLYLKRAQGIQGNRYDVTRRLELLAEVGLLLVEGLPERDPKPTRKGPETHPKESDKPSKIDPKPLPNDSQLIPKPILNESQTPLGSPKPTQPESPYNNNNNTNNNNTPPTPQGGSQQSGDLKKQKKEPPPPKFNDEQLGIAEAMAGAIRTALPYAKIPANLGSWADTIRLMQEQDGLALDHIWKTFNYANRDEFWKANIQSPDKLRKQFAHLDVRRQQAEEKHQAEVVAKTPRQPQCLILVQYEWAKDRIDGKRYRMADFTADPTNKMFGNCGVLIQKTDGYLVNPSTLEPIGEPMR